MSASDLNLPTFDEADWDVVHGSGIYLIRASDGRRYVGQARHLLNRLRSHERRLMEGKANRIIQAAVDSDEGIDLTFYVLEAYPGDGLTPEARRWFAEHGTPRERSWWGRGHLDAWLNERERYWIDALKPELNRQYPQGSSR
jgi:hypothetical protein